MEKSKQKAGWERTKSVKVGKIVFLVFIVLIVLTAFLLLINYVSDSSSNSLLTGATVSVESDVLSDDMNTTINNTLESEILDLNLNNEDPLMMGLNADITIMAWDDCPNSTGTWIVDSNYNLTQNASCEMIIVNNSATLTVDGDYQINTTNLTVDSTSSISANGQGCGSSTSPSASNVCASQGTVAGYGEGADGGYLNAPGGGAYGGRAGSGYGWLGSQVGGYAYGSALRPNLFGSGGGKSDTSGGGSGGGYINILVSDTLNLAGQITANGNNGTTVSNNYAGAGGSGGSIWVTTNTLTGSGNFTANGGSGVDGGGTWSAGGSGGRIAVYFNSSNLTDMSSSTVGGGSGPGSATDGTVGTLLFVDVDDNHGWMGEGMEFNADDYADNGNFKSSSGENFNFNNLTFVSSALTLRSNSTLNVANLIFSPSTIDLTSYPTSKNLSFILKGGHSTADTIFNISNSFNSNNLTFTSFKQVDFISANSGFNLTGGKKYFGNSILFDVVNLTVDSTSSISANGQGCGSSTSPSASNVCASQGTVAGYGEGADGGYLNAPGGGAYGGRAGSGYGWLGSQVGGYAYGSALRPNLFGSGGGKSDTSGGGSGGGYINILVSDTLNLAGQITANGNNGTTVSNNYAGAGGSGGSIWVTTNTLTGSGNFTANGGSGVDGGGTWSAGGSGGRIAVYYQNSTFNSSSIYVNGATAVGSGGAGNLGSSFTCNAGGVSNCTAADDTYLNTTSGGIQIITEYTINSSVEINRTIIETFLNSSVYWNDSVIDEPTVAIYNITGLDPSSLYMVENNSVEIAVSPLETNSNGNLPLFNVSLTSIHEINISYSLNEQPSLTTPVIIPNPAYTNSTLETNTTYTDYENETGTVYIAWYVNDILVQEENEENVLNGTIVSFNLSENYFNRGDLINVSVNGNDGNQNSTLKESEILTITSLPANISEIILNSSSENNRSNDNLTVYFSVTDPDNDSVKNITNWYLNGSSFTLLNMPFEADGSQNATDYSGHGNNGTITGATWNSTGGYDENGSYDFESSNSADLIEIPLGIDVVNEITAAFWVKPESLPGLVALFAIHNSAGQNEFVFFVQSNGDLEPYLDNSDRDTYTGMISSGEWQHIVLSYDGSTIKAYKNGALFDSTDIALTIDLDNCPVLLGGEADAAGTNCNGNLGNWFDGTIDEVMVFNHSLTAQQIKAIYENRTDLIVSQETAVGDNWSVSATPNDGTSDGVTVYSNNLTIMQSPYPDCEGDPENGNWVISSNITLSGHIECNTITVNNSAVVTVDGNINITVTNLTVDENSYINANALGCASSQSPFSQTVCTNQGGSVAGVGEGGDTTGGSGGGGGGHGGTGGDEGDRRGYGGISYDSALKPVLYGSGGGTGSNVGGAGGGTIKIVASDTFNLSGEITTDGSDGNDGNLGSGGGAGGSIWVTTENLTGTGNFSATGGIGGQGDYSLNGGGGGAGGRIAIYYNNSIGFEMSSSTVAGATSNGNGATGEDGTFLIVDADANDAFIYEGMEFDVNDYADDGDFKSTGGADFNFSNLYMMTSTVRLMSNAVVQVQNLNFNLSQMTITGDSADENISFALYDGLEDTTDSFNISNSFTSENLTFVDFRRVNFYSDTDGFELINETFTGNWFYFDVLNLTIDANSKITTDALGCASSQSPDVTNTCASQLGLGAGPGVGEGGDYTGANGGGGAGHGGTGGDNGENSNYGGYHYGSAIRPTMYGSGGGEASSAGGTGGGAIRIIVSDTFNLSGEVTADGSFGTLTGDNAPGGGSGGSIWVTTENLTGTGNFSAVGGLGRDGTYANDGGSGSGGRIAVYYNESTEFNMSLSTTSGGAGVGNGAAGEDGTFFILEADENDAFIYKGMEFNGSDYADDGDFKSTGGADFNFSNLYMMTSTVRLMSNAVVQVQNLNFNLSQMTITGDSADENISFALYDGLEDTTDSFNISNSFTSENLTFVDFRRVNFYSDTDGFELINETFTGNWFYFDVLNLTIDANSKITTDALGCASSQSPDVTNTCASQLGLGAGPGVGEGGDYTGANGGGGAGHGGTGGDNGENSNYGGYHYGSAIRPTMYGSGGGEASSAGGTGGGAIRIIVSDTFNLSGEVTAEGGPGVPRTGDNAPGGGSGGSIWVTTENLTGTGNFSAVGGLGIDGTYANDGGSGSGGRIAVYYQNSTFNNSLIDVNGGASVDNGAAGNLGSLFICSAGGVSNCTAADDTYLNTTSEEIQLITEYTINSSVEINRTIIETFSNASVYWNDSVTNESTIAIYNVTGLDSLSLYRVKNNSVEMDFSPLETDSNGNLPIFNVSLTSIHEINISYISNGTAPKATLVDLTSSDPLNRTNGTLTGSFVYYDADEDTNTLNETQWYNDSIIVTNLENLTSVSSSNTSIGESWVFSVRVNDGTNWSVWVNSSNLIIENTIPIVQTVNLTSDDLENRTNGTLIGVWSAVSLNGDPITDNETQWYNDAIIVTDLENLTSVSSDNTSKDESWIFSVRIYEGTDWSDWMNSSNLTIENTVLELQTVNLTSSDSLNRTNGTLTGAFVYYDADADTITLNETQWYNNSIIVTYLENLTSISSDNTSKDESWIFSVRVYEGTDWSDWMNSSNLTIENAIPVFDQPLTDQTVNSDQEFIYDINCSDLDDDTITYYDNTNLFDINSGTGIITDTPTESEVGSSEINVTCSDSRINISQIFTYVINDITAPNVTLVSPSIDYVNGSASTTEINFTCNVTSGTQLENISLYLTDPNNQNFSLNQSTNLTGTSSSSSWNVSLPTGNYTWNCLGYDNAGNLDWGNSNRTITLNYTAPIVEDTPVSSGGGGGGGGRGDQAIDWLDLVIINVDSPIQPGEFLDLTYLVKNMVQKSGDITLNFWLERNGKKISQKSDLIYFNSKEKKIEKAQLYIPTNAIFGEYTLNMEGIFGNYNATAYMTIEVKKEVPLLFSLKILELPPIIENAPWEFSAVLATNKDEKFSTDLEMKITQEGEPVWVKQSKLIGDRSIIISENITGLNPGNYQLELIAKIKGEEIIALESFTVKYLAVEPLIIEQPLPAKFNYWIILIWILIMIALGIGGYYIYKKNKSETANLNQLERWVKKMLVANRTEGEIKKILLDTKWTEEELTLVLERIKVKKRLTEIYSLTEKDVKRLQQFVNSQIRKEVSKTETVELLIKVGWAKKAIEEYCDLYFKN